MTTLMVKLETAKGLHDYDHAFISAEGVRRFAELFEVNLTPSRHRANPDEIKGLRLNDGASEAEGMCAAQMACAICRQLGVPFMEKLGRGSQLHEAARALTEHFEAKLTEHFAEPQS